MRADRRGEGLGRRILRRFEREAGGYAGTVSVAAAADVEGFYRDLGYEPASILLQVAEADLPEDYADRPELVGERRVDADVRFLYAGFVEYDPHLREELKERFGAFEANTVYEKSLTD